MTFNDLPQAESDAFESIASNHDQGHPPEVVAALLERGMIEPVEGGYTVPFAVHMDYCGWCADNFDDEGRPKRRPRPKPEPPAVDPNAAIGPLPGLETP